MTSKPEKIIRARLENGVFKPVQEVKGFVEGEEYILQILGTKKAQNLPKILNEFENGLEFSVEEVDDYLSTRR